MTSLFFFFFAFRPSVIWNIIFGCLSLVFRKQLFWNTMLSRFSKNLSTGEQLGVCLGDIVCESIFRPFPNLSSLLLFVFTLVLITFTIIGLVFHIATGSLCTATSSRIYLGCFFIFQKFFGNLQSVFIDFLW